ncbi:MAG TPA: TolC family protein [Fibrobacteria bacterium]|nr:TolC family protein [Fibrobacteria bacterium]
MFKARLSATAASTLLACAALAAADTLTLHAALTEALENNPGYLAARADHGAARNAHSSAGLAGYLPTVEASARHTRSSLDTRQERDALVTSDPAALSTTTAAGVNANWTLFEGFAAPLQQKRLRLQRDQAQAVEHLTREDLLRRAALTYADLARQSRIRNARDTVLAVSEERARILDSRLRSGSAGRPEWLENRVDHNADRAALLQQEAVLHAARLALAQALGRSEAVDEDPRRNELPDAPLDLAVLSAGLHDHQPSLQLAEAQRDLARTALHQAVAPWYPRLQANVGYNYNMTTSEVGFASENRTIGPTAGIQLTVNLFDGELPWRVVQRGRILVRAADLRLREVESAAQAEVERAYAAWHATDSAAALEIEGLGYARENLDLTMTRWKSGTLSYLEARLAQVKYLDAFTRAENARYEAFRARLDVLRAAGRMEQLLAEAQAAADARASGSPER